MTGDISGNHVVQAEVRTPIATLQLVHFRWTEPAEGIVADDRDHVLDLRLTPRPAHARGRYRDRWSASRCEPLGGLFLVPAGHAMQAWSDRGAQSSIICRLHSDPIQRWFDDDIEAVDRRLEASLDIASTTIRSLLLRMAEEARNPGFASAALCELIAAQLAIELARFCGDISDQPAAGGLAPWRLRIIDQRLADVAAPPALSELAQLCGLSTRQLTRGFRSSRGVSIGDHIERVRIRQALRLLGGRVSIKEVAHALGFASPSSFSYAFRRATGRTPREFRQRIIPASRTAIPRS